MSIAACQGGRQAVEEPTPIPLPSKKPIEANAPVAATSTLFDDFSYTDQQSMINHGWIIRTEPGWPGVPNAVWAKNSVSFVDDADQSDNRLLHMTSSTNGSATRQTQFCHQRKYLEGTYAARVRFTDRPVSSPEDTREYVEDVDWVYFESGQLLSPQNVQAKVAELRPDEVEFKDTVPNQDPPLVSPCNF